MEKKLFSNSVFSPVIIGSPIGFGANGDKHYEVVFSLAIVWMDGDDWIDIWEVIVIGQVIIIELQEQDSTAFQDIISTLRNHPELKKWQVDDEPVLSFPGLTIYSSRRKVFRDQQEIHLTNKEYEILLLLVIHKGWVLTYNQIYEKVWKDCPTGNERNTIGFHICNLREKLYQATPNAPFTIRSVREVGYCFEIQAEK